MGRIVLQQMCDPFRCGEFINRHYLHLFAFSTFVQSAQNAASDPAKAVNCHTDSHNYGVSFKQRSSGRKQNLEYAGSIV